MLARALFDRGEDALSREAVGEGWRGIFPANYRRHKIRNRVHEAVLVAEQVTRRPAQPPDKQELRIGDPILQISAQEMVIRSPSSPRAIISCACASAGTRR